MSGSCPTPTQAGARTADETVPLCARRGTALTRPALSRMGWLLLAGVRVVLRGEPVDDRRHHRFEASRHEHVERAGTAPAPVLEVVRDSRWDTQERTARSIEPPLVDEEAHRALNDVEDLHVVLVGMGPGSRVAGVQPPFRDAIAAVGFEAVCLEHRAH